MRPYDIKIGETYIGGKNGEYRTVVGFGTHEGWIRWAKTEDLLPLGGFIDTRVTSRTSFAKWANQTTTRPGGRT